ncbi:MAG: hypothetical protein OXN15_02970 [Chloroflexota bacterium]|nr:hypothetical protein [Chloroflexota bacterium]
MSESERRETPDGLGAGLGQPLAISLREADRIAEEVRGLIKAGYEHHALAMLRGLHPADMASILAGLPRTSRDTLLRVMSPDTVVWMLQQMNPVEAARFSARLGSRVLMWVIGQMRPSQALATLERLTLFPFHILRIRKVAESLEQPLPEAEVEEILAHAPNTAGALMTSTPPP